MKNRLWQWILTAVTVLLVPVMLLSFAFVLPARYDETYLAALQDKFARLKETEGKRIVLVGGSGAAFDVRSDLLETELQGYRVVNFGLYAGLGTTVLLDLVEPELRAGDLVLFLPEQSEQTLSTFFDAERLWQATDGTFPPIWRLNASEREAMLGAFPTYAADKARLFLYREKPAGDSIYARRSFNAWGDMACAGREQNRMQGGFDQNLSISFDPALAADDFCEHVNAFATACGKKGAKVFFGFCPMNAAAVPEAERARVEAYADSLRQRLTCPLLGTPESAIWGSEWFFDTNFHLNAPGQIAYTAQLAGLLKAALGDGSPVAIEIPAMPSPAAARAVAGDNRDADCFVYAKTADGFAIAGLSESGMARTELIVPAAHDGLPVTGFAQGTFAQNERIRQVTLDANILSIADGSFSGCTALERIVLRNAHPETCTVGHGLLDGTRARVAVPKAAFSAYATNYFWSVHADRIDGDETIRLPQ